MSNMSIEFGLILAVGAVLVLLIAVATVMYLKYYKLAINKQLHAETPRTRRLPSPWFFSVVSIFVAIAIFFGILAIISMTGNTGMPPEGYRPISYKWEVFTLNETVEYSSFEHIDGNPHYTKTVEQQGDIQFTFFTGNADSPLSSAFFIYADYTGDKAIEYYGVTTNYYAPDGTLLGAEAYICERAEVSDRVCIAGFASAQGILEVSVNFFSEGDSYSDWPFGYINATASETIEILMQPEE